MRNHPKNKSVTINEVTPTPDSTPETRPARRPGRRPGTAPEHPELPPVPDPFGPGLIKLTAHRGTGRWRKRHKGRDYYFGTLDNPRAAIDEYVKRWPAIINPRPAAPATTTLFDAFGAYLGEGDRRVERGDMSHSRRQRYLGTLRAIADYFGSERPLGEISTVEWAEAVHDCFGKRAPTNRNVTIQEIRTALAWIERNLGAAATTGDALRPVPRRLMRRHERLKGPQLVTPAQVRRLLKVCRSTEDLGNADNALTEACLLLAINAGMRQADIAQLTPHYYRVFRAPRDGIRGWINEPRAKTESPRRVPLWPETADAIERVRAERPDPGRLLTSRDGSPLIYENTDLIAKRFARLRARAWPNPDSPHRAVTLDRFRRTWVTVAKKARVDPPDMAPTARRLIAGHATEDVHEAYNQEVPDRAMIQIVGHVRAWLYGA